MSILQAIFEIPSMGDVPHHPGRMMARGSLHDLMPRSPKTKAGHRVVRVPCCVYPALLLAPAATGACCSVLLLFHCFPGACVSGLVLGQSFQSFKASSAWETRPADASCCAVPLGRNTMFISIGTQSGAACLTGQAIVHRWGWGWRG